MKKRVIRFLCAQTVILSLLVGVCGCGTAAPKADETTEIETTEVAKSDTVQAKATANTAPGASKKSEIDLETASTFECEEEGVTLYLPAEYETAKGDISVSGMDLTNGDGLYMVYGTYVGIAKDELDELLSKDEPTQEEIDHYYASNLTLFAIIGIDKNRSASDVVSLVTELAEQTGDDDSMKISEKDLVEVATYDDCTYYEVININSSNYSKLEPEFQKEYDMLQSFNDSIAECAEYYEALGVFPGIIGSKISFKTKDIDGNPITSDELFSQHDITMVNVWATWCGWCVNELPELEEINNRLEKKNCAIVGLLGDGTDAETIEEGISLLTDAGCTYQCILPFDGWTDMFDMSSGWPTSFLVDSTGTIVAYPIVGAQVDNYENAVEKALQGNADASYNDLGSYSTENTENFYRIYVVDEESNPVPDAMIQFCSGDTCNMSQTDKSGIATFEKPEDVYEVHVLKAPKGYKPDDTVYITPDTYSDITIVLEKE